MQKKELILLISLGGLIFFGLFYHLGAYPILDVNEGLYAQIAREMLENHQYSIPYLNHVVYLEKPPLLYWLMALSYICFGVSAFSARLVPAISAALIFLMLIFFAKKIKQIDIGYRAAFILASSVCFFIASRVVFFDILLALFFTAGLCFFYLWYEKHKFIYLLLFYLSLGLAFLTKGFLPIILIGGIVFIFWAIEIYGGRACFFSVRGFCKCRSHRTVCDFLHPLGIFLFLLVTLPWLMMAAQKQPHFWQDFLLNEQLYRFLNKRLPMDYHTGPIYFYLPLVFIYLFPWTLAIFLLFRKKAKRVQEGSASSLNIFLAICVLMPLLFFSVSSAKSDYYMLIAVPMLALWLGKNIAFNHINYTKIIFFIYALLLIIAVMFAQYTHAMPLEANALLPGIFIALIVVTFVFSVLIVYTKREGLVYFSIALVSIIIIIFYTQVKILLKNQESQITLANYIQTHDFASPVYFFKHYEEFSSLPFLLQKSVRVIESDSQDLYRAKNNISAKAWFLDQTEFNQIAKQSLSSMYVVVDKKQMALFQYSVSPLLFRQVAASDTAFLMAK